jgi:hypothetical protein
MASGTPCRCLDRQGRAAGGVGSFDSRKKKETCQTELYGFASTLQACKVEAGRIASDMDDWLRIIETNVICASSNL